MKIHFDSTLHSWSFQTDNTLKLLLKHSQSFDKCRYLKSINDLTL